MTHWNILDIWQVFAWVDEKKCTKFALQWLSSNAWKAPRSVIQFIGDKVQLCYITPEFIVVYDI